MGNRVSEMQTALAGAGYTLFDDRVWGRGGFAGIAYSDGDSSEDGLLATLRGAGDVSVFSSELRAACTDWPSFYHLSSERSNLMRPFADGFTRTTRVLEIGAGCGAVTRFLGETGAQVLALEGSRRRATIARERVRELDNVQVLVERFQDFKPDARFDVITLIGVLEYASVFSESSHPALDMLRTVRAMLAPGGSVLIAIENKLGLKYLAGVPEDHLGKPMVGVEGRYTDGGVRTWGRAELETMLSEAGFEHSDFHVPMPDYKTPVSIVGPRGLQADPRMFDAGTLAAQAVRRDRQLGATTFNLQRAWSGIADNQLLLDLGNSFLVRAGDSAFSSSEEGVLAWHYSTQRAYMFARESRFVRERDGRLAVKSQALSGQDATVNDVRMRVSDSDAYYRGPLLVEDFRAVLTRPGWTVEELAHVTRRYLQHLRDVLVREEVRIGTDEPGQVIPDHYIDATPSNLITTSDGQVVYFDREWEVPSPTLGWLTLRSLLFIYAGTVAAPMRQVEGVESVGDLLRKALALVYPGTSLNWVDAQLRREVEFQTAVTGLEQLEFVRAVLEHTVLTDRAGAGESGRANADMLQQFDRLSQSLHAGMSLMGDRVECVLEQQDLISQSLHAGQANLSDRISSVLEQQDMTSQSLHAGISHAGNRLDSVLEQQDLMSQGLHAGISRAGDRLDRVLEQQDLISQSLHCGQANLGDRMSSVLEQQDLMSQSLHAVTQDLAMSIQRIQGGVMLSNERADALLKQLDAVSQSLHVVTGGVGGATEAIRSDLQDIREQQLISLSRLDSVGSDLEYLKRSSFSGVLRRFRAWFRRRKS